MIKTATAIAAAAALTTAWVGRGLDPTPVELAACFAVFCAAFTAAVHAIRTA